MKRGQQVEVKFFHSELGTSVDGVNAAIENLVHITARVFERRQE